MKNSRNIFTVTSTWISLTCLIYSYLCVQPWDPNPNKNNIDHFWASCGDAMTNNTPKKDHYKIGQSVLFKNPYEKNKGCFYATASIFCTCVKRILCVITASMASCSWDCVHVGTCQAPSILILSNNLKKEKELNLTYYNKNKNLTNKGSETFLQTEYLLLYFWSKGEQSGHQHFYVSNKNSKMQNVF